MEVPYYDEDGILHYPIPVYDRSVPALTPSVIQRMQKLNDAASDAGMSPEEREAYTNIDVSGTYEVQTPEVRKTIDRTLDQVLQEVNFRRHDGEVRTEEAELLAERSKASSLHGHSQVARLVSTLPPLFLTDASGKRAPLTAVDERLLGKAGAKVIWEQEEFLRLNVPLTRLSEHEKASATITLAELEQFFLSERVELRRHMGDFIIGKSVIGAREAVIARVSYAFHRVDRYFICFFLRLPDDVFPASYIGKDPFTCSTGWHAVSRVVTVFYKCNCKYPFM